MSLLRPILNMWLRLVEKRALQRARDQHVLRQRLERNARLLFHAPRGMTIKSAQHAGQNAVYVDGPSAPVLLYFHGGGYVFGSPDTHKAMLAHLCQAADARAILPEYRKAPEHVFPAALDDAEATYLALLDDGVPANTILLGGDSAGGGLALSLLALILEKGHPVPAAVFAFSPLTDMSFSGPSFVSNEQADAVLPAKRMAELADIYAGGHDPHDPRISPLFARFEGAPPIWLTVGDTEILLDDSKRFHDARLKEGVDISLRVERDLPHVWPLFHNTLPEARATLGTLAEWIKQQAGPQDES